MNTREKLFPTMVFLLALCLISSVAWSQAYYASKDGTLAVVSDLQIRRTIQIEDIPVDYAFGALQPDGLLVVGSGQIERNVSYQPINGTTLYLVSQDGKVLKRIAEDVVDAFPSPKSNRIAFIATDFRLRIYQDGKITAASFENTTNYVAWFPDGERLVLTGRDADWSYDAMSSPRDTEEFLRMNTSNLFFYDVPTDTLTALTDNDQANYNPVVSPDGEWILFISTLTHYASFWRIQADGSGLQQLTNFDPSDKQSLVPVAFSRSLWLHPSGLFAVYDTTDPGGGHFIWLLSADGKQARKIQPGRLPRLLPSGNAIAYQTPEGDIATLALPAFPSSQEVQR